MSLDQSHFALIEYDRNFAYRHDYSNQCRNQVLLVHILLFRLNSLKRYPASIRRRHLVAEEVHFLRQGKGNRLDRSFK